MLPWSNLKIIHYSSACWRDFRKYVAANHNSWRAQSSHLDSLYRSKIQPPWLSYILPGFMLCYMDWLAPTPCRNTTYSIYQISLQDCLNIETSWEFSCSTVLWSLKSRAVYHLLIPLRPNQFFSSAPWRGTTFDEGFHLKAGALSTNIAKIHGSWLGWLKLVNKEEDGGFI